MKSGATNGSAGRPPVKATRRQAKNKKVNHKIASAVSSETFN